MTNLFGVEIVSNTSVILPNNISNIFEVEQFLVEYCADFHFEQQYYNTTFTTSNLKRYMDVMAIYNTSTSLVNMLKLLHNQSCVYGVKVITKEVMAAYIEMCKEPFYQTVLLITEQKALDVLPDGYTTLVLPCDVGFYDGPDGAFYVESLGPELLNSYLIIAG